MEVETTNESTGATTGQLTEMNNETENITIGQLLRNARENKKRGQRPSVLDR